MSRWVLLSGLVVTLLAGCTAGGGGRSLPADYRGVDVPRRTSDYVPPSPEPVPTAVGGGSDPAETVRFDIEKLLLPQIRLNVSVQPTCAGSLRPTGTARGVGCQVNWRGLQVPFDVEISGGGQPFYTLEVRQLQGLLIATAVRDAWAVEQRRSDEPLSCEASMPEVSLVPLDTDLPYRCAVGNRLSRVWIDVQGDVTRIGFS